MSVQFRRDSRGLAQILRSSEMARVVHEAAQEVAGNVRDEQKRVDHRRADLPVKVTPYLTDRRAAAIVLAHPAGKAMQAKHGVLTRAATKAGLQIRQRGGK